MATGKVSVVRRSDVSNVSRKVSGRCGGYCHGESDFRVKFRSNSKSDLEYEGKKFEKEDDEGIVASPPQKKRKFSPVLWGEKDAIRCSAAQEVDVEGEQEPGELDEGDFSRGPDIMKSRWASDDDVEECCGGEKGGLGSKGRRSSPESGVTQKDSSDGSGNRSSGSDGGFMARVYSEGECSDSDMDDGCDHMELDLSDDEDLAGDDSNKAEVSGQARRNMRQCSISVFDYEKL